MSKRLFAFISQSATLIFSIGWLIYMMLNNEVPTDTGDGIMHFFISQASWSDPALFLHHWGKPFFILLSSPFAQFGFNGMVVFNILVFTATVLLAYAILKKKDVSPSVAILFPLLLLKTYDVSSTILGGLTEPLFNLAVVAALYLLLQRKFIWFAVLVSFMPFLRSEGQLPILLAIALLVLLKKYQTLPFLFIGFFIYGLFGLPVYGDFFWYFTESPYQMNNGIYGSGPWYHYLISYESYIGKFGLFVVICGFFSLIYLIVQRKWKEVEWNELFFVYGIFIGVLFVHSYFWATGQSGSLGLTRIATQGMPAFVLLHCTYIGRLPFSQHIIFKGILSGLSIALIYLLATTSYFPKKADPLEKEVINAAEYLKSASLKGNKIYYHFPLFAFAYGENSLKRDGQAVHHSFTHLDRDLKQLLKPGDIIVRDSHFGPQEMHLPLGELEKHKELLKIKDFISAEQASDPYNEMEGVSIYQYVPLPMQQMVNRPTAVALFDHHELQIGNKQEFTELQQLFNVADKNTKITLKLRTSSTGLILVYDVNQGQKYAAHELNALRSFEGTFLFERGKTTKLYIWNPKQLKSEITLEHVISEEVKEFLLLRY